MQKLDRPPKLEEIRQASQAIARFIIRTPVFTSEHLNKKAGTDLFFKCENFQKVGAFKMRGAACAALALSKAELECGLTTHSSGNHAQAVARAADLLKTNAYIVMPENAPRAKVDATKGYAAQITFCSPTLEARESTLKKVQSTTGATFIHPYNNYNVIAGQGTAVLELLEEYPKMDIIIAPVGGGGLLSGTAIGARSIRAGIKIFGAEPINVNDAKRSFDAGSLKTNNSTDTIADGLKTNLGEKNLDIILRCVDDILCVTETEIIEAMRVIWQYMKVIIEPSAAVPLAAILKYPNLFHNKKTGVLLSGGNVDLNHQLF